MSSQLSYRLHGREQRPKTLRKHYRDELDTGQVKASAKELRGCSRKAVGDGPQSVFCACLCGQFRGTTQADGLLIILHGRTPRLLRMTILPVRLAGQI